MTFKKKKLKKTHLKLRRGLKCICKKKLKKSPIFHIFDSNYVFRLQVPSPCKGHIFLSKEETTLKKILHFIGRGEEGRFTIKLFSNFFQGFNNPSHVNDCKWIINVINLSSGPVLSQSQQNCSFLWCSAIFFQLFFS